MNIYSIYEMVAHHYINRKKVTLPCDMSDDKKILILATGKSANDFWNNREKHAKKFKDYDILVMNRSIYKMKEQVFEMKPKYLAMCDSIYWGVFKGANVSKELVMDTYHQMKTVIEEIDWDCYLITTIQEQFDFVNERVKIIRINATDYDGNNQLAYWLYKNNFAQPGVHNVAQLAIYFGLTFGYKEMALVGVDFDFIKNLYCDRKCRIGQIAEHQYDQKDGKVVVAYYNKENEGTYNNSVLAQYMHKTAATLACFGKLSMYAEKMNCRIYNYSLESLLDCYEKKSLEE